MRISDWSSDVCSSDLAVLADRQAFHIVDIDWRNEFGQPLHENSRFAVAARDDTRPLDPRRDAVHQRIAPEQQQKTAIELIRIGWPERFEERRVGQECVSTCCYRWSLYDIK